VRCYDLKDHGDYIADDRLATPEYFEYLKGMTDEEFARHIERLKNQAE